jgi:putative SOS response-associated peptidase YedK
VICQNSSEPNLELSLMHWGLIPSWAKDSSVAARVINAGSETASTKPAFRDALKLRRCLILADGWKSKRPHCFDVGEGKLFAFAGIWGRCRDAIGDMVESCSILTTTWNAQTSAVHDRMPVILDPDSYDLWLDPGINHGGTRPNS